VEPDLRCQRTRGDIVRAAEGRKEVVERIVVRQVDDGQLCTPFVPVAVEQVVMAHGHVEEAPVCDTRRLMVVVLSTWWRYVYERRAERRCGAVVRQWDRRSCADTTTSEPGFSLLIS